MIYTDKNDHNNDNDHCNGDNDKKVFSEWQAHSLLETYSVHPWKVHM